MATLLFPRHHVDAQLASGNGPVPTIPLSLAVSGSPAFPGIAPRTDGGNADTYTVRILQCLNAKEDEEGEGGNEEAGRIRKDGPTSDHRSTKVFLAGLIRKVKGTETETLVVCKVSCGQLDFKRLSKEATFYTTSLIELQNKVVPEFFGFYTGTIENSPIGIALLKYCGKPLSDTGHQFKEFSESLRNQIYQAFAMIHRCKVVHNDLAERNVLCDHRGHIWIIDFGLSKKHREVCRLSQSDLKNMPNSDMDCTELENVIVDLDLLFTVDLFGVYVSDPANPPTFEALVEVAKMNGCLDASAAGLATMFLLDFDGWQNRRERLEPKAKELEEYFKYTGLPAEAEELLRSSTSCHKT